MTAKAALDASIARQKRFVYFVSAAENLKKIWPADGGSCPLTLPSVRHCAKRAYGNHSAVDDISGKLIQSSIYHSNLQKSSMENIKLISESIH